MPSNEEYSTPHYKGKVVHDLPELHGKTAIVFVSHVSVIVYPTDTTIELTLANGSRRVRLMDYTYIPKPK